MALNWSGERFLPGVSASIAYEHYTRYFFSKHFLEGKSVLDAPSGEGYGAWISASVAKDVVGIDISEESVNHAKAKYVRANLRFQVGDLGNLPFEAQSFDVITCFEGIEHIPEEVQQRAIEEMRRVLKPNGILFISTPNKRTYSDIPHYKNEFHTKEFYTEEFVALIKAQFPHLQLYGQTVIEGSLLNTLSVPGTQPVSNIPPLPESVTLSAGAENTSGLSVDPNNYVYLILVASSEPMRTLPSSYLLADFEQLLRKELTQEIEKWFNRAKETWDTVLEKGREIEHLTAYAHALIAQDKEFKSRPSIVLVQKVTHFLRALPGMHKLFTLLSRPFWRMTKSS